MLDSECRKLQFGFPETDSESRIKCKFLIWETLVGQWGNERRRKRKLIMFPLGRKLLLQLELKLTKELKGTVRNLYFRITSCKRKGSWDIYPPTTISHRLRAVPGVCKFTEFLAFFTGRQRDADPSSWEWSDMQKQSALRSRGGAATVGVGNSSVKR